MTTVRTRAVQQVEQKGASASGVRAAATPGFSSNAVIRDLGILLGSGQLAVPVEKALTNELKRLSNLASSNSPAATRLSPKVGETVRHRLREIDTVLEASILQPSMERQLEHEKSLLLSFTRYCGK